MSTASPSRPAPPASRPRPSRPGPSSTRTIDPFRLLRRHMVLLIFTGVIGVFLGVATFFVLSKFMSMYSNEVLFEIRSGLDDSRDVGRQDITHDDLVTRLASTELMLLVSRGVLEASVKSPDVQTTQWFQKNFMDRGGALLIDEAVDELEEDLGRRMITGTNLFGLQWSAPLPADVPVVLNTIGRAYLRERERQDNEVHRENLDVFQSELSKTMRELDDLNQRIEVFIREHEITTLDDPRSNQLAAAVLDIQTRIAETKAGLNITQTIKVQTEAKLEGMIEPTEEDRRQAMEHPAARPHEIAVVQQKTMIRELREKYLGDHYSIRTAESRLRAFETEYEAKLQEIMRDNLRSQLKTVSSQIERFDNMVADLETEYEEKSGRLRNLAADMATYLEMEDQRDHLALTRDMDLELIKEVRLIRLRADSARIRMYQPAQTPREKSFPKIQLIVPAVAVMLMGLVTGLLFLREITDQRVKSASDLMVVPDARVLGVIPELAEDPSRCESAELVIRRSPQSVSAESYRQTWGMADKAMSRFGHQTILVVGGLPEAGTTTIITNFAAAAAAAGRRVVVVDANFRRSRLATALGSDADHVGLGDVLVGKATAEDCIQHSDYGIDVVSAGSPSNRIFERLNDGNFDRLMADLRHRYDIVLVDAPPAVVAGDALVLANKVDAAVLVIRAYQEQRGLVARLVHQLIDAQCELLGIVLNRPRGTAGGYFKKNFETMARYSAAAPAGAAPPTGTDGDDAGSDAPAAT